MPCGALAKQGRVNCHRMGLRMAQPPHESAPGRIGGEALSKRPAHFQTAVENRRSYRSPASRKLKYPRPIGSEATRPRIT